MKLFFTKGWTGSKVLVSKIASEEDISGLFKSLDWLDFNSVMLEKDSKNWIEVSGNLAPDGLAIVFEENGVSHVSDNAPQTIEELEKVLGLFLKSDSSFNKYGFTFSRELNPSLGKKDRELWKVRAEANQIRERRRRWFNVFVAIIIVGGFGSVFYLWVTDELKFLGRKTDYSTATVTSVSPRNLKGGFVNVIAYEFNFKNNVYTGHFWQTSTTGSFQKGNIVKVKFVVDDPSRSKIIARIVDENSLKKED